ncbi:hypothetical protein PPYR_06080 [Photinus pyralis]|nr:nose resistant to fluoxetine protein 6-like [Photinus pyralis]KAB0800340.1 hypothetical protein PPYR_06080 [Photinus pyralis]
MLQDIKFHILSAVTTFVLVLILISTAVDYCLSKDKDVEVTKQYGTTADPDLSKKSVKVGIFELPKNVLLCFSAITNGRRILNVDHLNKESIACLHGLRFFSISWIILVHSYLEVFAVADNKTLRTVTERSYLYQTISNGTFSVDTFFFISGLLLTTTYLKRELKTPTESGEAQRDGIGLSVAKNILLILYRYIRLTPAYLFVLGLNELAIRYYHNFSVFSPAIIDHISCPEHWWRNALYINNFYPLTEFCMLWSWYMSNDMQFFVIAIVLLAIAARNEKCFRWIVGTVVVFLFTSWVVTFIIAMQYKYVARIEEPFALFDQLYDKPWLRIGPYLIGMATGYLLLRMKYKMVMPKVVVFGAWVLSLGCLLVLVYGLGRDGLVIPVSAFYASLGHTAWGLAIAWITIACSTGYGGPIDSVLSFRGIYPLSRLTYCAYLIHPVIMCITSFEMDGPFHLHQIIMLIVHFGNTVASFVAAFLISLGFEAPFVGLIKIMTGGKR